MPRTRPNVIQNFLSGVLLPLLSISLLPISLAAVAACMLLDKFKGGHESRIVSSVGDEGGKKNGQGCVIISGGRMSKGLTLARAFKRAGWKVIGVEEEGWGELCPMRFSASVDAFHLLPPASKSYSEYADALIQIAKAESATLFIPVSGAGSSVEDARAAETMSTETKGRCRTFIQDPGTMLDLHDKDRFMALVDKLGFTIPSGKMIEGVDEGIEYLRGVGEKKFVLKCMGLDENRGDMTLFPVGGDGKDLNKTRRVLEGLNTKIAKECPYVFQEYIPGPEWCTHASVINGKLTSFVACPSNDMLMTYENGTYEDIGKRAEEWTITFLNRLSKDKYQGKDRRLTGHFSFDFIIHSQNGELYPIECNARVHTAIIMLPLSGIADCYPDQSSSSKKNEILRPNQNTAPRSWIYNDLIMRYLPLLLPSSKALDLLHPSLPATLHGGARPSEDPFTYRVDPTLVADDWVPFLVLWHVYWPSLLLIRWWKGIRWTRLNVSTGRIFEA